MTEETTAKPASTARKAYICQWNIKCDGLQGSTGDEVKLTAKQAAGLGKAVLPKSVVEAQRKADAERQAAEEEAARV